MAERLAGYVASAAVQAEGGGVAVGIGDGAQPETRGAADVCRILERGPCTRLRDGHVSTAHTSLVRGASSSQRAHLLTNRYRGGGRLGGSAAALPGSEKAEAPAAASGLLSCWGEELESHHLPDVESLRPSKGAYARAWPRRLVVIDAGAAGAPRRDVVLGSSKATSRNPPPATEGRDSLEPSRTLLRRERIANEGGTSILRGRRPRAQTLA